jgi:surface protein
MSYLFYDCSALTSINVTNFDTSNVMYMNHMFRGCSSLTTLNVTNFDTSNVTTMEAMFSRCSGLTTLDVTNFDTSNVTDMSTMFYGCSSLSALDVTNFNTSNVTDFASMFYNCTALTSIMGLNSFDTSNVTKMYAMFYHCSGLTKIDASSFDTSNVTDMYAMFDGCSSLTTIYASDLFSIASLNHSIARTDGTTYDGGGAMFTNCTTALVGGNGTVFSTSNRIYTYAKIDKAGQPGYFTYKGVIPSEYQNVLYIAGTGTLDNIKQLAADVDKDSRIKLSDYVLIRKHIAKTGTITI